MSQPVSPFKPSQTSEPDVLVLLCCYNGAPWLAAQLDSIAAQEGCDWALWISDDGSVDETLSVLEAFMVRHPERNIHIQQGPKQGAAQNFLWLLCHPDLPIGPQTHVAISDQDDIWLPHKLSRALATLRAEPKTDQPLIYGAQSWHVDNKHRRIGHSRVPRRAVVLQNAVVQNMVSGHSLMLNPAALALARKAGRPPGIAFHDWWLSLLVLACGGKAVIDREEVLLYRQHDHNLMGAPQGIRAAIRRVGLLFDSKYRDWLTANLEGLQKAPVPRSAEADRIIAALAPKKGGIARLIAVWRLGLYRQSKKGTFLLYLAVLLGFA